MNNQRIPVKSISCNKNTFGITRGKIIYLRREGSLDNGGDFFKINSVAGEGGSCVCYEATLIGEGKTGRLKEFYPLECSKMGMPFSLERDAQNHIVASEKTKEAFISARTEFVESYHNLRKVIEKNKNNSDFTNFISDFTIYYGCDSDGNILEGSTAYIWTTSEKLTVFDKYIAEVHKHPNINPEHKLFNILKTMLTLTECVKILHENRLLHLDIKPKNFGVLERKGELLTDSIKLFDVNTIIYSPNSSVTAVYGTEGFRAPEIVNGQADNTSDIYSIGCTLFSALVDNDEIKIEGYSKEYYTKITQLIDSSKIISASETNSNVYLKHELVSILKNCLAESKRTRYQSCEDLANDLKRALAYLYPAEVNTDLPIGKQLVVLEKEAYKKLGVGSYLTFMYHLYKKPLFECLPADSETLDVVIIGFGNYGQMFLDCCLQVGQILGKKLSVHVVSNDRAEGKRDKDIYLSRRPALVDFFSIDGSYCKDPYGYISFENKEFVRDKLKINKDIALEIVSKHNKAHYVFVALGDDSLNKGVAKAITSVMKDIRECSVNFAYDGEHLGRKPLGNPVYMCDDIASEALYKDIERMAFNAHLIWESGLNIDLKKSYAKFKEQYNYNASFSNVVSIKYKLYSFGIALDDLTNAATECYRKMNASSNHIKNELIALEHRRWVCEKICAGWACNQDLESCVTGEPNDKKAKRHICLLRSTASAPLQTAAWTLSKWDNAEKKDLDTLDDLDQMSVRLHQVYMNAANSWKKKNILLDSSMLQLRTIASKSAPASIAFSEWYSCLSLLWNGNSNSAREYNKLKRVLLESLEVLNAQDISTAKALITLIDSRVAIILKSMRYTDYKNYDADLVKYIPFILTYRRDIHLLIPFSCGANTKIFENVAAATVVNPFQITYLFDIKKISQIEEFKDALYYTLSYMREKTIAAKINFVITHCKDEKIRKAVEQMKTELFRLDSRIKKIIIKEYQNNSCVAQCVYDVINTKLRFDAAEQNDTYLSGILLGAGVYSKYPHYRFDINTRKFYETVNCEFLKFIRTDQYLKISDMFASKNSKGYLESPTAFYNDYEALWKEAYRKREFVWKKMCGLLEDYHKSEDKIMTINTDIEKANNPCIKYRFLVPAIAYDGVQKFISTMIDVGVFTKESEVLFYTTDSCEVNIYAPKSLSAKIKSFMADPYVLSQPESIEFVKTPYSVVVSFDYLTVQNVELKGKVNQVDNIKKLLQWLENRSFITDYIESGEDNRFVSFTYATKRIKKLLTNAGNILEIYIYHKCLKSGLFDDVATSYEINWEGTPVKSEFDIIITKGFAGLLVEAKATENIDQGYYFKLSSLANQFSTNCMPVLIADTVEQQSSDNSNNEMQRQRGNMLDVITISNPKEIDNIDITLARLLNIPTKATPQPQSQPKTTFQPQEKKQVESAPAKNPSQTAGKMTREEYLAQNIKVLGLDQSKTQILTNNKIRTIGDFLKQTEETFSLMKGVKIFVAELMTLQKKKKEELEKL